MSQAILMNTGGSSSGGGDELNFTVVGSTTQPSNPKENTIWLNTNNQIKEYRFSAEEPKTRANGTNIRTGDVWIKTSYYSKAMFNALKSNILNIYPNIAYQWNGSSWEYVATKVFINSEWVDIALFFYYYGKQFKEITGGWDNYSTASSGWVFETDNTHSTGTGGSIATLNKVDLTNVEKLIAIVTCTTIPNPTQTMQLGILSNRTVAVWNSSELKAMLDKVSTEKTTLELDVSHIKGSYYLGVSYNISPSYTGVATLYELYALI